MRPSIATIEPTTVPTIAQMPCVVDQKQEGSSEAVQCAEEEEEAALRSSAGEGVEGTVEGGIRARGLV